ALTHSPRALALARHDPENEELVQQLSRQVGAESSGDASGLTFEEAHRELLSAAERVPVARPTAPPPPPADGSGAAGSTAPFDFDRLVAALGTPAAPPQLEAVIEGRPVAAPIDLPPPGPSDVPNPFAALEAELRAQETARAVPVPAVDAPSAAPADASVDAAPEPPAHAASETATVVTAAEALVEVSVADALAQGPAPALDFSQLLVEQPATLEPPPPAVQAEEAGHPGEGRADLVGAAATSAAAAPAGDDLLGDLEGWLNTLHERSNG
ncbi:MAG: hypothetical protein AB7O28_22675, partial [Vicinamibacterales bacterium]